MVHLTFSLSNDLSAKIRAALFTRKKSDRNILQILVIEEVKFKISIDRSTPFDLGELK